MGERSLPFVPFVLMSTGWGATSTWDHRAAMELDGRVFPVVAEIPRGYQNARFKFQAVPVNRPFVLAASWRAPGEEPADEIQIVELPASPRAGRLKEIFPDEIRVLAAASTREALEGLRRKFPKLRPGGIWPIFVQVHRWGAGRACHFPPGVQDVAPLRLPTWGIAPRDPGEALGILRGLLSMFSGEMRFFIDPGPVVEAGDVRAAAGLSSRGRSDLPPAREAPRMADRIQLPGGEIRFSRAVAILAESKYPPEGWRTWQAIFWSPGPVEALLRSRGQEAGGPLPGGFGEIRARPSD